MGYGSLLANEVTHIPVSNSSSFLELNYQKSKTNSDFLTGLGGQIKGDPYPALIFYFQFQKIQHVLKMALNVST